MLRQRFRRLMCKSPYFSDSSSFLISEQVISQILTCLFCVCRWWSLPGTTINFTLGERMNFDLWPRTDTSGICLVSEVMILHQLSEFYCFLQLASGHFFGNQKHLCLVSQDWMSLFHRMSKNDYAVPPNQISVLFILRWNSDYKFSVCSPSWLCGKS